MYEQVLRDTLQAARERDYAGYGKFDALNSPLLAFLSVRNAWLRFFWIQLIKQCPFHVRPLLGVRTSRNPKGIALFARAYLFLYQKTEESVLRDEARTLIDWLIEHPSPGCANLCWGYNFVWQDVPPFLQASYEPNVVVTVFVGEALIHAYRVTGEARYLEAARSVADFITQDVPVLYESDSERAISYLLTRTDAVYLNIMVLSGALLAKIWKETGDERLRDIAERQVRYTVNKKTDYHAWYYTHPRGKSPIRHDNYHTGGILDGILEYTEETGDEQFMPAYWDGLRYYHVHLFEEDGAPRWMSDRRYPHDVHGAAQGIISFSKAGRYEPEHLAFAGRIARWAVDHLYRPQLHDFVYRKGRLVTWNYSLMRWCNAWMARGLGELEVSSTSRHVTDHSGHAESGDIACR